MALHVAAHAMRPRRPCLLTRPMLLSHRIRLPRRRGQNHVFRFPGCQSRDLAPRRHQPPGEPGESLRLIQHRVLPLGRPRRHDVFPAQAPYRPGRGGGRRYLPQDRVPSAGTFACKVPVVGYNTQREAFLGPYGGWDAPASWRVSLITPSLTAGPRWGAITAGSPYGPVRPKKPSSPLANARTHSGRSMNRWDASG